MDFIDQIKSISQKIQRQKDLINTEEATKNAFVLPLISALGYDIFDITEVCPEYIAATPGLKGEKVDYAIHVNGVPAILMECKWCGQNLDHPKHSSQLYKYFNATSAKCAILTNGILYQFYSDTGKDNIMDDKPFFEFNLADIDESLINELKRFFKVNFNPEEMGKFARNMLYTKEIKRLLAEQLTNPSPEFVKFFANQVYNGRIVSSVVEKFTDLVKQSLKEYINDRITDRLKSAINLPDTTVEEANTTEDVKEVEITDELQNNGIVTTEEELEGFRTVKSILREVIDINRLQYKDQKSYFSINIDGNSKQTICRLRFNGLKRKYIGIMDLNNREVKHPISQLNDIYGISKILKDRAKFLIEEETTSSKAFEI